MKWIRFFARIATVLGLGATAIPLSTSVQGGTSGNLLGNATFQTLFTNSPSSGLSSELPRLRLSANGLRVWTYDLIQEFGVIDNHGSFGRTGSHDSFGPWTPLPALGNGLSPQLITGMNHDGSTVAFNQFGLGAAFLWSAEAPNPVRVLQARNEAYQAWGHCADFRYLFGLRRTSGSRGDFVRLDLLTSSLQTIATNHLWVGGSVESVRPLLINSDGSKMVDIEDRILWTAEDGVKHRLPSGFQPTCMDASGRLLGGSHLNAPALAEFQNGSFTLSTRRDYSEVGSITAMSADGSVKLVNVTTVIAPNGDRIGISELVPQLNGYNVGSWSISADGRTLAGICHRRGGGPPIGWVADIFLPGDGPRLARRLNASRRLELGIPTRRGYRYQVEHSTTLDRNVASPTSWIAVGSEVTGDGETVWIEPDRPSDSGFYRVQAVPTGP
jgi:hypothetical protein